MRGRPLVCASAETRTKDTQRVAVLDPPPESAKSLATKPDNVTAIDISWSRPSE
jgi:hypothetical protein